MSEFDPGDPITYTWPKGNRSEPGFIVDGVVERISGKLRIDVLITSCVKHNGPPRIYSVPLAGVSERAMTAKVAVTFHRAKCRSCWCGQDRDQWSAQVRL